MLINNALFGNNVITKAVSSFLSDPLGKIGTVLQSTPVKAFATTTFAAGGCYVAGKIVDGANKVIDSDYDFELGVEKVFHISLKKGDRSGSSEMIDL